jgi:hypothetical protein
VRTANSRGYGPGPASAVAAWAQATLVLFAEVRSHGYRMVREGAELPLRLLKGPRVDTGCIRIPTRKWGFNGSAA